MQKPEKFKFIIFDLDGVIFDLKKIWKVWSYVCRKHNINVKFKNYFDKISLPLKNFN